MKFFFCSVVNFLCDIVQLIFLDFQWLELWFSSIVKLVASALIWVVGHMTDLQGIYDFRFAHIFGFAIFFLFVSIPVKGGRRMICIQTMQSPL